MTSDRKETGLKMRMYRDEHLVDIDDMARRCEISRTLLKWLEGGHTITHPNIAARVCKEYELDVNDYNAIVSKEHQTDKLPKPIKRQKSNSYYD